MRKIIVFIILCSLSVTCFAQRKRKVVKVEPQVEEIKQEEISLKRKVAIARFSNETQYAKGIFYDKNNDPMARQALDILSTKLVSSEKFILLERQDLDKIMEEMRISGSQSSQTTGADYLIIGSVTEFGRKNVGDVNAFSRTKTQTVEAAVSIRLVDVSTGQIIYSEEAKGEAETSNKTVMGLGERTDYDATLSDKAISVAISKLVENIINNCMNRPWKAYFLSADDDGVIISGGKSQGIEVGDEFEVVKRGKIVENPQTKMNIELPGQYVGKVKIDFTGGDTPVNEFSMVSFIEGEIDSQNLSNYYIKEIEK